MRKISLLMTIAALFVGASLLVPNLDSVYAQKQNPRVHVAPGLEKMMKEAAPGEMVTALVKLKEQGPPVRANLGRSGVLQRLRDNARISQAPLKRFLNQPAVKPQVEVLHTFWIDELVLLRAPRDVLEQIAHRTDVVEMFDNFTVTLPPQTGGGPMPTHQAQPWDNIGHIGAKQVWSSYGITGAGVRIGGLDTGVDISHPDLAGKMITTNPADPHYPGGWAEFDTNGNIIPGTVPHDSDQHGTHTTGTMIGGSASGYAIGVAPGAKLIHGLVLQGGSGSFAEVAGGMEWIIDPDNNPLTDDGAQVVNMSLGATGTFTQMVAPTDNMVAAGVFPSFSIGNSGPGASTTGSPGNVPSAFGVGATDNNDVIASFSSRGPVTWDFPPYTGTYTKPDISAPGVQIFSTVPGGEWEYAGDGFTWSGTSMAAPHVSGTVALMRQANPSLSVDEIKQILAQTSLDLGSAGMDNDYGAGRVNAFAAVSAALVGVGTLQGTVSSSGGGTVDGASVRIVDTGQRVYTDATGHYSMKLVAGSHSVEVSRFGYETLTTNTSVTADQATTLDVTLTQLPSGTVAGVVTDLETAAGVSATISVKLAGVVVLTGATNPATGAYSIALPVGTYDLVFSPVFPYPLTNRNNITVTQSATTTVNVQLKPAEVLLVDDDAGKNYETYFQQAIAGAGRSSITVSSPPSAADMARFDAVVWLTGDDYSATLSSSDEAALATYLDGGGKLFITGQEIGYDTGGDAFYANYLHAHYVQDDVKLGAVNGSPASPVGVGFSFDIKGGTGANNQAYADEIDAVSPAQPAFFYNPAVPEAASTLNTSVKRDVPAQAITSSGCAGLSYEGAYRLVYFSFGFEAIANESDRTAVMDRVLDWLQGFPKVTHTPLGDTEDTQHPYNVRALITSDYFALAPATLAAVYSANGGPDASVPMTATGAPNEYQASIPAQALDTDVDYYITASDVEGHTTTHPLGAPATRHHFAVANDDSPPAIVHAPLRDTNDRTGPYGVKASVTDNIGVEAVYLLYSKNGGLYHRVKMAVPPSPVNPDEYVASIPGPAQVGDRFDYYILAMDESYSGNVTRHPATGTHHFTVVEEFVWDFESDDGGFTPAGNVWQWGAPTSGPGTAHSGTKLWATVLGGNYPNSANATLDLPAITIAADRPYTSFSFWHWYNMENEFDGGNVKVSTDGGATFQLLTPARGYDATARTTNAGIPGQPCFTNIHEAWQQELFDLSSFAGQQVILRFHFGSDGSVQRSGWYIDDLRLRSSSVDDVAPSIANVTVPPSSFNSAGPYSISATVKDLFSGVAGVALFYNVNGGAYSQLAMTHGSGDTWSGGIPGQPAGSRITFYVRATDVAGNAALEPADAPASTHAFSILPSAETLVIVYSTGGATTQDYRTALEAHGHAADYWDQTSQGALTEAQMQLYKMIILDARSGINASDQTSLSAFLNSGTQNNKKRIFLLGRDLGFSSTTRDWISRYMRADYVQDNPNYFQISGEPGDPIGMGETFNITGSYPDEMQRSSAYPGGVIVYRYSGAGGAISSYAEIRDEYQKGDKEWDGVMPHAPISLDAAAGIRYDGALYRSVYFAFNLEYITDVAHRADIVDRVINWTGAPEIVHTPLSDTENTSSPYTVKALVYSSTLDPSRIKLTYDTGGAPVVLTMTPTGNPNEYSAGIPAQSFGTTVSYYISASNTNSVTTTDPEGAPAQKHVFHVISDNLAPVIAHTPLANSADLAGPYTVSAKVTDNVGVDPAGVLLVWNKNGGSNTTVPLAAQGGDVFKADIPGPAVIGDVFNYFITARDVATVPNIARDPASGYHSFAIVDYITFDFEAGNGGFAKTGPDWEWGDPTSLPSDAHSGTNVWATKLSANYSASSNSRLETSPLVVPSSRAYAQLSFWQWYDTEQDYDGGNVKISTDGGATWTLLTPDIGYTGTGKPTNAGIPNEKCFSGHSHQAWEKATFNLTAYKGQTVMIRWHFGSDSSVQYSGWAIDDVLIESVDDTAPPVFTSRTIPASTASTVGPYPVKCTVVDGLSGVASVNLKYSTNGGSTYSTLAMAPTATPNEYSASIPGQPGGTRIRLYMEASDVAGNGSKDPVAAPATTYQFGILPSGDYLVITGGSGSTDPLLYQDAFATLGRSYDYWNWDASGVPPLALLNAYHAVIIDEGSYLDATQIAGITAYLDTNDGTRQQVVFMGRDLEFGASARPFMEKYTGAAYVQDNPSWFRIKSTPGDPIGANETFVISGSYPDELKLSTTYPGAVGVYKYNGVGAAAGPSSSEIDYRAFLEKEGKEWDPKLWPLAPTGPDSLAAVRYTGTQHAAVYFAFNLYYIQEPARRAAVLGRALDWLASTATVLAQNTNAPGSRIDNPRIPDRLTLGQNYPNPFNPRTRIEIGIPAKYTQPVTLKIYNVNGQVVRTVFAGRKPAGYHVFDWDGTDDRGRSVASGVYFARFITGETQLTRKMVLLK